MRRWLLLLALPLLAAGCSSNAPLSPEAAAPHEPQPAAPAAVNIVEPPAQAEHAQAAEPTEPFKPDDADLTKLIFWGALDGFFGLGLQIPRSGQILIKLLLGSGSPAVDKYVIDLAAFPNPYREQVLSYLHQRYGSELPTVYDYPQIFDFDPSDSDTLPYRRFKHALFDGQFPDMARMMDPDAARTIDTREVMWGGVRVDGIPPLESPAQLSAEQAADWINDSDEVVGIEINGDARAYPIRIIAWHEMVNDTIGGVPVSLAYCTLCGSAILYDGRNGSEVYRFGTSGLLYRSNKLMYDRTTRTLWNQFSGRPAWGPLVSQGIRLQVLPVVHTSWGEWYKLHPDSTVLSIDTGFQRDYGPGAAYADYNSTPQTWFNVPITDDRLAAKDAAYVVRVGESLTAYPIDLLVQRALLHDEINGLAIVVIATADGAGGRSYETGGQRFERVDTAAAEIIDTDGGIWAVREDALAGPNGASLSRVSGHNAFWFAIVNQTSGARLYEE